MFKSLFYFIVVPIFLLSVRRETLALIKRSLTFRFAVVWLVYLSLTLVWSEDLELRDFDSVIRGLIWISLFFAITIAASRQERIFPNVLFIPMAFVAAITAVVAMVRFYADYQFPIHGLVGIGQLSGNSVDAGMFYGAVVLTTGFGVVGQAQTTSTRTLSIVALTVLLVALVLTGSRGSMVGVASAVLVWLVATSRWKLALLIISVGLAGIAIGAIADFGRYDFIRRGSSLRLEIWSQVWDRIVDAFWFGHGIATDPSVTLSNGRVFRNPHQLFLANHFYGGVPATLLLLLVLGTAAHAGYRRFRSDGAFTYGALLIFMVVVGMFEFNKVIKSVNLIWFYVWFPLALLAGQEALLNEKASREKGTSCPPLLR